MLHSLLVAWTTGQQIGERKKGDEEFWIGARVETRHTGVESGAGGGSGTWDHWSSALPDPEWFLILLEPKTTSFT